MTEILCEKSYVIDAAYTNFYTGGDLVWSANGEEIFCYNTKEITKIEVKTGQVQHIYKLNENNVTTGTDIELEDDVIYTFAVSIDNKSLVTAHRSGLLRLWSVESGKVLKLWKSQHKGPIVKVQFSPCCKLVCSSGADSTLRVWDFIQSRCVTVLRDYPGPSQLFSFHPNSLKTELLAVGVDNTIYYWNYVNKKLLHQLRGHISSVTSLSFECGVDECGESQQLVSVSRDKVVIIWRLTDGKQMKVIPMYEELEGVCWLPITNDDEPDLIVASGNGTLRLVHSRTAKICPLLNLNCCEIKQLLYCRKADIFAIITAEQNILIYKRQLQKLECTKQMIGFNDEVLDLCFLGVDDRYLAVATNSKNIKVYDTAENMNCKLISGHKDTVITLSSAGANSNLMLSSGKDHSILLWELQSLTDSNTDTSNEFNLVCVGKNISSHTSTIGSISFGVNNSKVFATVCQDGSMKVWQLKYNKKDIEYVFELRYAVIAHDKEINCVSFSPNNKLIATASQDKTVKLWSSEMQSMVGTLRGHTRGVWCVRFSSVDQILMTSSADCSIRLWSLSTFICLKRFEQECSILRAEFIDHSKYIIAAGSDGLLKTWNVKSGACMQTLDEHTDRIWSLAVSQRSHKYFYSGGADSKLVRWRDATAEQRNAQIDKQQINVEQEQNLQNLLHNKKHMERALALALKLGKPNTSYDILKHFVRQRNEIDLRNAIKNLSDDQRTTLLDHAKMWNTNSRHAQVANIVMQYLLRDVLVNPKKLGYNTQKMVEVLTPYEQRHFKRLTEMQKDLAFLEFVVKCM